MKNPGVLHNILVVGLSIFLVGQFGVFADAATHYQAKWVGQLEGMSVKQGDSVAVWVDIKNTGTVTWVNTGDNAVKIATVKPSDRVGSKMYHSSWLSDNRVAVTDKEQIIPGEVGRFSFTITAGGAPGKYREYFGLVAEGITWLDPFYFYIEINIQPAVYTVSWVNQSASPTMTPGEETVVWVDLKNTGNTAWLNTGNNAVKLGTARLLDRASNFASSTWLSPNRASYADKIIQPGEVGRFTFTIKAPEQVGTYKEYFCPVVEGVTWVNDLGIYWEIIVNEELVINNPINVGLSSTTNPIILSSSNGMVVRQGSDKGMVVKIEANNSATVTARNGGYIISVSGQTYDVSDWVKFIPLRDSIVTVSNDKVSSTYNRFRGILVVRRSSWSGNVWMVNELEVEDYLKGLAEVPDSWPIEARKAQVVAARTFAVRRIQDKRADIFDLYDDTRDQVYYGYVYEINRPGIAEVVNATTGLIIKYGNQPIAAYYFSDSGGATENVENAWNNGNTNLAIPYLKGVPDPYAKPIEWEASLSQAYLREIFGKTLEKVGAFSETVTDLIIDSRYPSGRLKSLTIVTSTGKRASVTTATFEALVDSGYVKSTNFTVGKSGADNSPTFTLQGKGWGHGVGMPQWSAYNMAQAGQTFDQILKYFYTGVTIASS
ncbi:MAG: SpoIID/LytB domain-containing protein [Patescibacteria group bacterium]